MILFLVDSISVGIQDVVEGLYARGVNCVIIQSLSEIEILADLEDVENAYFAVGNKIIAIRNITGIYFRLEKFRFYEQMVEDIEENACLLQHLNNELFYCFSYLISTIPDVKIFGKSPFSSVCYDKLQVLHKAKQLGMLVPPTVIVSNKQKLQTYIHRWERVITKPINNQIIVHTKNIFVSGQRTEEITVSDIFSLPEKFFPTLIQKLIIKKFDIRVVYFNGDLIATAILSQDHPDTTIDFRNYSNGSAPYMFPYQLDQWTRNQIVELMALLNLNYGAIDLVKDEEGRLYFLEVNPDGQYGFSTESINISIPKLIVDFFA